MHSSLTKDSLVLMIGRGIAFLISLATPLFLVRFLSVHDYGEYRQIILIIMSGAAILPMGMMFSLYYFFPHYPEEKDVYLSRTIATIFAACCFFLGGMIIFKTEVADYFNNSNFLNYAPLVGLATLFMTLSSLIETVLVIEKRVFLSSVILSVTTAFRSIFIIIAALMGGTMNILCGLTLFLGLKTIWSMLFLKSQYGISIAKMKIKQSLAQFQYAMPIGGGGILGNLTEVIDKFLVSHYLGSSSYAIYSTGCYEIPFVRIVFSSIGDIILPRIVALKRDNDIPGLIQLWQNAIVKSLLFGAPLFLFSVVFASDFITVLFTQKYAASVPIFQIAVITVLLESTRSGIITRAFARTSLTFYSTILSLAVMVPLCYFGIQTIGLIGAVGAVTFSKAIQTMLEFVYSKFLLQIQWSQIFPYKNAGLIGLLTLVSIIPARLAGHFLGNMHLVMKLSICFTIFFAVYAYSTSRFRLWALDSLPIPRKAKKIVGWMLPNNK